MSKQNVRIRRSATHAVGNLVTVDEPTAITLCKKPANERPYQVVRSDESDDGAASIVERTASGRVKRTVRRNDNPVLALTFPVGFTEEDVIAALVTFDMVGYTVTLGDNGVYTACRSDLQSLADIETTDIKLNKEGIIARLDASQYKITRSAGQEHLRVVAFEFDTKRFDSDAVSAWIAENNIDSTQDAVENATSNSLTVKRSDIAEGTDVRRVQLEEGVIAIVARSDVADVPSAFAPVVNEAMYGNWGWGQIDFDATMADREFCTVIEDANWRLNSVMDNIILHSQLPLEQRKALVDRSLAQYGDFVKNVIDALPRQVMLLVTRAADKQEKEPMKNQPTDTATTQRADAATAVTTTTEVQQAATQAAATTAAETLTISRADLEALIDARVAAATAAAAPAVQSVAVATAEVQRSELTVNDANGNVIVTNVSTGNAAVNTTEVVTRSDLNAALADAVKPLLEQIQNTVVLRSDAGDRTVQTKEQKAVKRGDISVFNGMFGQRNPSA